MSCRSKAEHITTARIKSVLLIPQPPVGSLFLYPSVSGCPPNFRVVVRVGVRVGVRIAIMHIVLRCRTGSLSCCLEVDFGVEVATWSCPRGLELLVGSGSWWWAMVHRAQI